MSNVLAGDGAAWASAAWASSTCVGAAWASEDLGFPAAGAPGAAEDLGALLA